MHAKLSTKVSNRMFARDGFWLQVRRRSHVRLKPLVETVHTFQIDRIRCGFGESKGRCFSQELSRIVFALFPNLGIEIAEDAFAVCGPAPPVIPGQALKWD